MGIWNKIWGKIQEQSKIDSIIFDAERKLIDIPTLLNCTIKDICLLTEEKKDLLNNQIAQNLNETNNTLTQLKTNLESLTENNAKKQVEYDIKKYENHIAKLNQTKEILNNEDLQLHYLLNYQNRLNATQFFENDQIINIFEEFQLSPNFEPNDLIVARENLENNAYTLPTNEKNEKIDRINRYYEILIDPIRLKGYRDTFDNPNTITILENRIKELQQDTPIQKKPSNLNSTKENNETINSEISNISNIEVQTDTNDSFIETLNDLEIQEELENHTPDEPHFSLETIDNVNKDLLEEQKQKIEEQLIPSLIPLNKQIKETHNDLLYIAKNSLLKQHQNILNQNPEYQKILEELAKLN
ncbi:MAG: hypothetical protein HFI09_00055 [Bacilli bacterium]|nr:hypothetical protein [Bacilli bacterium]